MVLFYFIFFIFILKYCRLNLLIINILCHVIFDVLTGEFDVPTTPVLHHNNGHGHVHGDLSQSSKETVRRSAGSPFAPPSVSSLLAVKRHLSKEI